jgi:hypothetical protein
MSGVKRWLFNFVAVASLVLCLVTLMLWGLGFWKAFQIGWVGDWSLVGFSERSLIGVRVIEDGGPSNVGWSWGSYPSPGYDAGLWSELKVFPSYGLPMLGIAYERYLTPTRASWAVNRRPYPGWRYGNRPIHSFYAPHWLLFLITLVLPAVWAIRFRGARNAYRIGLCPICGYDLRATPDRCPECGTVSKVAKGAAA